MRQGQAAPKLFGQPKRWPRDVSWSHPGELKEILKHFRHIGIGTNTRGRKQRRSTMSGCRVRNQIVQPKQLSEPGVASALTDEGDSGNEDDGTQTNSTRLFDLSRCQRGGPLFLNSPRQVVCCHVKSGIACFQMPEDPELQNDLKLGNGASSGSGDLSKKRRSDCKRKLSNCPEYSKLKSVVTTIHSAVRNMLKIRSWSNHRLVGSTLFKRNSTDDAQRNSQKQTKQC